MPAATNTTNLIAQTLASMIFVGVTGITSRCSIVPCSRSRMEHHLTRQVFYEQRQDRKNYFELFADLNPGLS
jgi:hypothetical protein